MKPKKSIPVLDGNIHSSPSLHAPKDIMSGALREIAFACVVITCPMLAFTALLLCLLFFNQVYQSEIGTMGLQDPSNTIGGSDAYYVDINSTTLVFIASWSSSLAPILVGFVLTLYSYTIAKDYKRYAREQLFGSLLTPYQLSILLRFVNGSAFSALANWVKYLFFWRGRRQKQAAALPKVASIAIIAVLLSFLVFGADTWLHITTKTVPFLLVSREDPIASNYSMVLRPRCLNATSPGEYGALQPVRLAALYNCALWRTVSGDVHLNQFTVNDIFNNASEKYLVRTHGGKFAYLSVPESDSFSHRDFTATTWAVSTKCRLLNRECNLRENRTVEVTAPFYCTEAFQGDLKRANPTYEAAHWQPFYFNDSTRSNSASYETTGVGNPFYFGLAASIGRGGGGINNTELVVSRNGAALFVIGCNSTVFDVRYDHVNGSITRFITTPSNESVTNIVHGSGTHTQFASDDLFIKRAAWVAVQQQSVTAMEEYMALAYSRAFVVVAAGSIQPAPAEQVQLRSTKLVTRLPKAPLFLLVGANLLFVVVGLLLTFMAVVASMRSGETRELQARLSIEGLVALYFEGERARAPAKSIEELFWENDGRGESRILPGRTAQNGFDYMLVSEK
jgi:hypothetical protein